MIKFVGEGYGVFDGDAGLLLEYVVTVAAADLISRVGEYEARLVAVLGCCWSSMLSLWRLLKHYQTLP
jgi:hypothetical protein